MKYQSTALACVAAIAFSASSSLSQQPEESRPVTLRDISGGKVQTPEYQTRRAQPSARARDWFQIITTYESDPDWLDDAQFTYYVLVKNKKPGSKEAPQSLFKGEVSYINVEKGRHKSDMYLHPSTLSRYGDVQAIAVLVTVQGRLVGMESKPPSNQRWWEALQPQEGFLLNRMQTPFAMLSFDDYEAVKPKQ